MRKDKLVSEVLGEEAAITPSDLYNTEFKNALVGGYDKDNVDEYLERVADVMESLINQIKDLKAEVDEHKGRADAVKDMEHSLRNALISSQRFGDDITDSARREADAMLAEARLARARAEHEATLLPEEIQQEIRSLETHRDRLRMDMRAMLAAHQALLGDIPRAEDLVTSAAMRQVLSEKVAEIAPVAEPPLRRPTISFTDTAQYDDDEDGEHDDR